MPGALAFVAGLQRHLAPLVAGLCLAWGVWLLEGALVGDRLIFETGWLNTAWLLAHGVLALGAAAAVMGVLHLRKEGRAP